MFLPPSLFSPALWCFVFRHLAFFLQKCDFQSGFAVEPVFAPPFFSRNTCLFWALLNPSFFDALFLDIMWPAKKIIILLVSFLVLWCFVFQHLGLLDFYRFASLLLARFVSRYSVRLDDVRCEAWISIFRFLGSKSFVLKHLARPYVRSWAAGSSSCWLLVWGGGGPTGRNPFF